MPGIRGLMSAAVGTYGRAQSVSSNNFKVKDKVGLAPLNYSNMLLVYETLHGQIDPYRDTDQSDEDRV